MEHPYLQLVVFSDIEGLKFTDPIRVDGGSPEEFLSGNKQSPKDWKTKEYL